jgi:hypothetical protein
VHGWSRRIPRRVRLAKAGNPAPDRKVVKTDVNEITNIQIPFESVPSTRSPILLLIRLDVRANTGMFHSLRAHRPVLFGTLLA